MFKVRFFLFLFIFFGEIVVVSQLLTSHYEQRWKYLLNGGQGDQRTASVEELLLSTTLFWGVFKALAKKVKSV